MVAPVVGVANAAGKALNPKNLIVLALVTVIIMIVVQKVVKQTVVLTDSSTGNVVGTGEIKTSLAIGLGNKA